MDPDRLDHIMQNLTRPIPEPYRPPPKSQGSWDGLKPGQRLQQVDDPQGAVWEVVETTNEGATLRAGEDTFVLQERGWKERGWVRVRKERSR